MTAAAPARIKGPSPNARGVRRTLGYQLHGRVGALPASRRWLTAVADQRGFRCGEVLALARSGCAAARYRSARSRVTDSCHPPSPARDSRCPPKTTSPQAHQNRPRPQAQAAGHNPGSVPGPSRPPHGHAVDAEALQDISARLAARMIEVFDLDTSSVASDMTNFATYIDTTNSRAPIAQRGKVKKKRTDLRLVGGHGRHERRGDRFAERLMSQVAPFGRRHPGLGQPGTRTRSPSHGPNRRPDSRLHRTTYTAS